VSADNCLATLQLKDGFRIADIHMIWDGDEEELFSPYNKVAFSQSEHYQTELDADAAEGRILEVYRRGQRVLEYGCCTYPLDMTWDEYLAAGKHPRVECPVCNFAVRELHSITPGAEEKACQPCLDGDRYA